MEIREMLDCYEAPNVRLIDIVYQSLPQKRLLKLLIDNGIQTTNDLRNMSDAEILALPLFGRMKMKKLRDFIPEWYEADFPIRNHINTGRPETVIRSLQEDVFVNYTNMMIIVMRGQFKTLGEIAAIYGQSRQSIQDKEKNVYKRFAEWYRKNHIDERIGTMDELALYADTKFPEDQTDLKAAVHRLVTVSKWKNKAAL